MAQLPPTPPPSDRPTTTEPRLFVEQRFHDLGVLAEGDRAAVAWTLENKGEADLVLEMTKASCGCTVVKRVEEGTVIPPGGRFELVAEFNSQGKRGTKTNHVTVYSNDPAEPAIKLEFAAEVEAVYDVDPGQALNLRMLRRGESASRALELWPAAGRSALKIVGVDVPEEVPLIWQLEPLERHGRKGQRIVFTVSNDAPLGPIDTTLGVHLDVDGMARDRAARLRAEVVADLIWQPKVVDVTRLKSSRGKQLPVVTIRSTETAPFDVLGATAGPLLDVAIEPVEGRHARTQYRFVMTIRDDAPPGPFATTLGVRTNLADQPIVSVLVYGVIAPLVAVDPPIILLRQDDSPVGMRRRVKFQASPQTHLGITDITCTNEAIKASLDDEANMRYKHLRYFDVRLVGRLPSGTHEATLIVSTNVAGAERIEVPIRIDVP